MCCEAPVLAYYMRAPTYYDVRKGVTMQCDASTEECSWCCRTSGGKANSLCVLETPTFRSQLGTN